jgi:hypothetical protein
MDPHLETYKQTQINRLSYSYNQSINSLKSQLITKIKSIQKSKLHPKIKNINIKVLIHKYINILINLKRQLDINIKQVHILNVVPERKIPYKLALLVGINYKNTPNQLYGCINDTKNIKNLLQTKYDFNHFAFLTDDTNNKPTKTNIIYAFTKLLSNSISGDIIVFLYSGHGTNTTDLNQDELDGRDEVIVPIDATNIDSCILDDELNRIIKDNLKPGVKLFALFDCCFSGTILDLKYNVDKLDNVIINPNSTDTLGELIMISGCSDEQYSIDAVVNNKPTGAMTFSFIHTIEKYGKSITFKTLLENMRLLLNGFDQTPQLSSGQNMDINTKQLTL